MSDCEHLPPKKYECVQCLLDEIAALRRRGNKGLPINVYCEFPEGKELIAQVANVRDVKLFFEPYNMDRITWNADDLDERMSHEVRPSKA